MWHRRDHLSLVFWLASATLAVLLAIAIPAFGQPPVPDWDQRLQELLGSTGKIPASEAESRFRALLKDAATADQKAAAALAFARFFADGSDERRREADPFFAEAVREGSGRFALDARNAWGVALLRQQRYSEAVDMLAELDRAQALVPELEAPTRARYLYNYGAALERTGQIREAISLYEQALRYDPGFERASNDLLRSTLEMTPFGLVWYVPASAPTVIASLDALFSPLLEAGRIDTTARYLEFLWDQRLVLVDKERVFPRWAYWFVRYLAVARLTRTEFELQWLPRLQDPKVDESVRRSPWLSRIRESYQQDLPLVLDPAQARDLTSPWSLNTEQATALSELLRTVGDAFRDQGDRRAALARYSLAWSSAGNWKAGLYLTELVQRSPAELDADGRILATLAAASTRSELAPNDAEGWRDLSRFNVLLAQNHERQASPEAALDAWERAVEAHEKANALASTPELAPGLYASLGGAYLQAKRPSNASTPLATAANQYLILERPVEARREAWSLLSTAALQVELGDVRAAEASYTEALGLWQRLGDPNQQAIARQAMRSLQTRQKNITVLRMGMAVARDFHGGEAHVFELKGQVGKNLLLTAVQDGIDIAVILRKPDGSTLGTVDRENGRHGFERSLISLGSEESFWIEVRARTSKAPPGRYEIDSKELPTSAPEFAAERLMTEADLLSSREAASSRRQALELYRNALQHWRKLGRKPDEARTLLRLASVHYALGEAQPMREWLEEALPLFTSMQDCAGESEALYSLGLAQSQIGLYSEAIGSYRRSLERRRSCREPSAEALVLQNICLARLYLGQWREAIPCQKETIHLLEAVGEPTAAALNGLGGAYSALGESTTAKVYYERALAQNRAVNNVVGEADLLNNLAVLAIDQGSLGEALGYYGQALEVYRKLGNRFSEARILSNLGHAYLLAGDAMRTLELSEEALAIRRELGDKRGQIATLDNLGLAYQRLGVFTKALMSYEEALRIAQETGDSAGEALTLNLLAYVKIEAGDLQGAQEVLQRAVSFQRKLEYRGGLALALLRTGEVEAALGKRGTALSSLEESLEQYSALGDRSGEAASLAAIAAVERDLGTFERHLQDAPELALRGLQQFALGGER